VTRINNKILLSSTLIIFLLSLSTTAIAQGTARANIDYIDNGQFPLLKVYVSVTDVQGLPIKNLTDSNFIVTEDGQPVSNFELTPTQNSQQPLAITLVIDTSGSMGIKPLPTPLQNAIAAAKTFVNALSAQDQVAIIGFADSPYTVQDFTTDKDLLKTKLDSLTSSGETTMYDGIVEAVKLLKNRSERRILVLIADGKDTGDGQFNFTTSMDEASRWAVPIYPIGFGNVDRKELEQMAALTGGTAQIHPNSLDLQSALSVVLQILREQYLIRYMSTLQADAAEHDLHITIDDQGRVVSANRSFIALPGEITITLPFQEDEVVGGNVLLKPNVLAPAPLKQMDIQLDGSLLQSVLSEPFEYAWDSTTVSPGSHRFVFTVTDQAGNTAKTSMDLDIQPPVTVKVLTPTEGEELSGTSKVVVDVNSLAGIAKVEYAIDGKVLESLTAPPFDANLNWDKYSKGPHLLSVKATDVNGFTDKHEFVIQAKGTRDIWFLVLVIVLGLAVLGIPIGLRQRRKSVVVAGKTRQLVLLQVRGQNSGQTWTLGLDEIKVGRRQSNDVQLKSSKASREHGVIRYENGQYVLYNLRQENPPLINNIPVYQRQIIKPGDVIQFGEDVLRYEE
jgi:VWFA-related protein